MKSFIDCMPPKERSIAQILTDLGAEVFFVGGSVRDHLRGSIPHDYDITTNFTPDEIVAGLWKKFGGKISLVGKSFGVIICDGVEIATYRSDCYGEKSPVKFELDVKNDAKRRDLTINCLYVNLNGELYDPFNGQEDLKNGIIRFVGDPKERIFEDPDRIFRACRFLATLEGEFAPPTFEVLRRYRILANQVHPDRIRKEIMKALVVPKPSIFFGALAAIGTLDIVFPEFGKCLHHQHGRYHWETIWDHLMVVGDSISPRFPLVRLAGYFHDCGKPYSFDPVEGSFIGHEYSSKFLANKWMTRLLFSNEDIERVTNLIETHMLGVTSDSSPKAIRKFRKTLADRNVSPQDWLRLRFADRKGNIRRVPFTLREMRDRRRLFEDFDEPLPFTVNSLALRGGDLIRIFSLTPGPVVGKLQRELLEWVVEEGPEFNTIEFLKVKAADLLKNWEVI